MNYKKIAYALPLIGLLAGCAGNAQEKTQQFYSRASPLYQEIVKGSEEQKLHSLDSLVGLFFKGDASECLKDSKLAKKSHEPLHLINDEVPAGSYDPNTKGRYIDERMMGENFFSLLRIALHESGHHLYECGLISGRGFDRAFDAMDEEKFPIKQYVQGMLSRYNPLAGEQIITSEKFAYLLEEAIINKEKVPKEIEKMISPLLNPIAREVSFFPIIFPNDSKRNSPLMDLLLGRSANENWKIEGFDGFRWKANREEE